MSTAQNPKKRIAFTDKDRQSLRLYHKSYPSLSPHQLASWFESEYGRKVSNSSVYDILSEKYAYLDNSEATDTVRKKKGPQWAELEDALFRWWQDIQPREVTGKELKTKANELWRRLSVCRGKKVPSFSDGWLSNWRVRHGLAQSTRATDKVQANFDIGRSEEAQRTLAASVPWDRQNILSPQVWDLAVSNSDPPFTLPIERRPHFAHMNLPYSTYEISVESQFLSAWPSTPKSYPAIASLNQGKPSFRICETRVDGQHRVKRAKLTVSQPLGAANFHYMVPYAKPPKAVTPFDKTPWKGVQELILKFNALKEDDLIMSGNVVVNSFKPILSSSKYFYPGLKPQGVAAFNIEEAIRLFVVSENFRVRQRRGESQHLILEEWFLEFLNYEILRSQSPEYAAIEGQSPSSCSPKGVMPFRRPKGSDCLTTNASFLAKDGRVDICTKTYTSLDTANSEQATQNFQAELVITPPKNVHSVPQTTVHLATQTTRYASTQWTPIISFRTVIPEDSMVFKIAKSGTSTDLQMILSSSGASLSDCDPEGRSLINYALQGRNSSTLKFLTTKVANIDAYEFDGTGRLTSLIGMLESIDERDDICIRDRRLMCLKLMLLADADSSLKYAPTAKSTTFDDELLYGTVAAVKALLDLGQPYVSANSTIYSVVTGSPLLVAANHYSNQLVGSLDLHEKIFLLLERGADIATLNNYGETCLHSVLGFYADMGNKEFQRHQEEELKDILMCMVTAEVDVYASNNHGRTVSQLACKYGHEELWREVLAKCGFDPDKVFSIENDFNAMGNHPGMVAFSVAAPDVRSTKLSFQEYGRQRKSLDCVKKVYSREDVDMKKVWREREEFWDSIVESSDSEDYEWVSVEDDDGDDGDEDEDGMEDEEYSTGNEEYSDSDME